MEKNIPKIVGLYPLYGLVINVLRFKFSVELYNYMDNNIIFSSFIKIIYTLDKIINVYRSK